MYDCIIFILPAFQLVVLCLNRRQQQQPISANKVSSSTEFGTNAGHAVPSVHHHRAISAGGTAQVSEWTIESNVELKIIDIIN